MTNQREHGTGMFPSKGVGTGRLHEEELETSAPEKQVQFLAGRLDERYLSEERTRVMAGLGMFWNQVLLGG